MMIPYDRFYKKVGIRRSGHFTSPLIIEASSLLYPKNSNLYYFKVSDVVEKVSSNMPLLNKPPRVFVQSKFYYSDDAKEGNFIKIPFVVTTRIEEIKGKEKKLLFLRPNVNRTLTPLTVMMYNYSSIGASYRYMGTQFTKLYKFKNLFQTVLEDLAKPTKPRHKFLIVELPDTLPKLQKLNLFSKSLNLSRLKSITSYKYFTLFELWKFINPEQRKESLFNLIPEEEWENITLLLTLGNKVCVFNMGLFKLLIREYNSNGISNESILEDVNSDLIEDLMSEYDLTFEDLGLEDNINIATKVTYKASLFKRMFYIFLFKIINKSRSIEVDDIEELVNLTTNSTKVNKEKKKIEIDRRDTKEDINSDMTESKLEKVLDTIIEEDIPISNVSDKDPDSLLGESIEEEKLSSDQTEDKEIYDDNETNDSMESKLLLDKNSNVVTEHTSLDLILKEKPKDPEEDIIKNVSILKEFGTVSKLEEKKIKNILQDQKSKGTPYNKEDKLNEVLYNVKPEEKTVENPDVKDNNVIFDKSYNKNTTKNFDKAYINKSLQRDTVRTVYALQNFNNIIEDYQIETDSSILDSQETHTIKIRTLTGSPTKLKFYLPKIEEDGSFRMSGNRYLIRKQRTETPIKKISATKVVLNSYYGKVFISKAVQKKDDYGYWLSRQLTKLYEQDVVKELINGTSVVIDRELPIFYSQLARYVLGFRIDKYNFNFKFKDREDLVKGKDLSKIEQNEKYVVCGSIGSNIVILMEKNGDVKSYQLETGVVTNLPRIEKLLDLDLSVAPIEYTSVKIGKGHVPIVLLLSYYLGLENLLKVLKVTYEFSTTNKRVEDNQSYYKIKFKDGYLIIKQDYGLGDIILSGLDRIKTLDTVKYSSFQDRSSFHSVFSYLEINVNVITEIKILEKMFVDPMTRILLEQLGEPETFKGLLFRACELLLDDNARHPNNMTEQVIKGYERLNGILYRSLVNAVKDHEKRANFSKSKIELDPYVVMKKIKDDSSTVLIDDLNPLAMVKQTEDVTYLGEFGRQEITMTKETRVIHPSEIGVISEAAKDNGSVGVTAYLSGNPSLTSLTGTVGSNNDNLEWGDILSTSALLSPFSTTDDSKRLNFINIQSAHVIPINEMSVPYVRTGYESILPVRTGEKFVTYAEDEGTVESVSDKEVVVKYRNTTKTYKLYSWTTKEESGSCFTYKLISNVNKGDKLSKDDTITYNPYFFEPDIFNPKRVIYKQGTTVNVAIVEDPETFEDSGSISKKLSSKLGTVVTKVRSIVLDCTDNIHNLVKIGDEVKPGESLFSFTTSDDVNPSGVTDEILSILQDIKTSTPKSKVKGTISNIVVYYNCEIEDLSDSLKKIVKESDSRLKHEKGFPGKVNSSYSIKGKPLNPKEIEIKIYTTIDEGMSIGDKAIFGNQLKFTVGSVFDNIVTEDGTEVDATFGFISIQNRIVNSPNLLGTTNTLVKLIQDKAVEMYFK